MINQLKSLSLMLIFLSFAGNLYAQNDDYIIQRGDAIDIQVMDHPEFSIEKILVLPDGFIQYPALGSIKVAGTTSFSLMDTLKKVLTKYVVNPIVTVYIRKIQNQQINIFGYVNKPGQYQIFEPIDIYTALGLAGGIRSFNKVSRISIVRDSGRVEVINLRKYFRKGGIPAQSNLVLLYPGNTVYVREPREINWALMGFIITLAYSTSYIIVAIK